MSEATESAIFCGKEFSEFRSRKGLILTFPKKIEPNICDTQSAHYDGTVPGTGISTVLYRIERIKAISKVGSYVQYRTVQEITACSARFL